jgi:hypothetical protein
MTLLIAFLVALAVLLAGLAAADLLAGGDTRRER